MISSNLLKGQYEIVGDINKGSYGVVSLAKDVKSGELVAIKCISKSSYEDILYEVEMHKKLGESENIVELIDFFDENNKAYLVLEYCAPGDLYEAIKGGRGPREQNCVLDFMLQLIDAVEYCHQRGVYHRDIKPENILIGNDGTVKLADWGLATTVQHNNEFGVGSERYMAPELFDQKNTNEYDAEKVDIWSIGICLLNILFGRNPFTVASQKDKLFLDFATSREALFDIFPSLSEDVFAALRHCLTMDPDNRNLSKFRKELLGVRMWTTDEYYEEYEGDEMGVEYGDDYERVDYEDDNEHNDEDVNEDYEYDGEVEEEYEDASIEYEDEVTPAAVTAPTAATPSTLLPTSPEFISTTTNRQPFRTPTGLQNSFSNKNDIDWSRTMQFTPPTKSQFFPNSKVKTPSNLSFVLSATRHSKLMNSVCEEDEEDEHTISHSRRDSEGSNSNSSILDDGIHDDVFTMDNELTDNFNKLSLVKTTNHHHHSERNSSGSDSSISSVPSLIQSEIGATTTTTTSHATSNTISSTKRFTFNGASSSFIPISKIIVSASSPPSAIPSSAPPSHDFLKLGKSWSDIDFEDDEEYPTEDDFHLNTTPSTTTPTSHIHHSTLSVPSPSPSKHLPPIRIKSIPSPITNSIPSSTKSHQNSNQNWIYPHWVN